MLEKIIPSFSYSSKRLPKFIYSFEAYKLPLFSYYHYLWLNINMLVWRFSVDNNVITDFGIIFSVFNIICAVTFFSIWCQNRISVGAYSLLPNPGLNFGRCPTLIHPNEWNITVRCRGSSNNHICVMLLIDSNHLPAELQARAITYYL